MRLPAKLLAAALAASPLFAVQPAFAQAGPNDAGANPDAQSPAWHSQQQIYLLGLTAGDGWHFVEGGVRWRWIRYLASDRKPTVADRITVHYEGRLLDGTVFDSSYQRGSPATFSLGRLVEGWQRAIPQMGVGEIIEIAIPSNLAYGPVGRGPIPGNATLVFKVELIAIED
ncbi:FKBP-type peptidyl-prolyl cis-trans isomerase [Erythrobacter sanguineus]|jgi:FKBP-type peptidyl-prolyl cis-trans isomerase|uniref:Peptidyl-prolyl cis-trans isomerase n=1 Tax=Erythrobacter sanguineus TaxID=198312 RepID=A0A1M7T077_9SPHN|nr:FKBP-type peptidyl-prolyl cis-trans isomerase [Erythrobacter sanguineus]MCR9178719.1 FKBP-type peptidyl-prolyl cis-trans isomerase [Erythrobacteraceae bacterium]SHN64098.1 FKBP-type peptidyl-prolyl cis-trans isomerase [Erythrobacter sanguineus]